MRSGYHAYSLSRYGPNPLRKFVRPPTATTKTDEDIPKQPLPQKSSIGPLTDDDIKVVAASSDTYYRKQAQILSRLPWSICIHVPRSVLPAFEKSLDDTWGSLGDKEDPSALIPIAWALRTWDGSIGGVHVDAEFRRRGLATLLLHHLVKSPESLASQTTSINGTGGAHDWSWVDVQEANSGGLVFYRSLAGWEEGWRCYWMNFPAGDVEFGNILRTNNARGHCD